MLQEPGSYVGEVVKVMGKKKVLVKVQPEGKYGQFGWNGDELEDLLLVLNAGLTRTQLSTSRKTFRSRR